MTNELTSATEDLYRTFSGYKLNSKIDGCPCCVSEADKSVIHTASLRNLTGDDLGRYAFKAMTTWGDVSDFKHFLPRIFELLSTTDFPTDTFVVLGKLEYAKWESWSIEEIEAIKNFLLAWWSDHVKSRETFNGELFMQIHLKTRNIQPLLDRWTISFEDSSFRGLVDFIYCEVQIMSIEKKIFGYKNIDAEILNKIKTWLLLHEEKLEKGFYHFEKTDPEFSERISICYDLIKNLRKKIL